MATLAAAFDDGLSVFQAGGAAARQQLLAANVLIALTNQSGAWLWAATVEAVEHPTSSTALLAAAIVDFCSNTAAMLFADAAADFTTGVMAGAARSPLKLRYAGGTGATSKGLYAPDVRSGCIGYARTG